MKPHHLKTSHRKYSTYFFLHFYLSIVCTRHKLHWMDAWAPSWSGRLTRNAGRWRAWKPVVENVASNWRWGPGIWGCPGWWLWKTLSTFQCGAFGWSRYRTRKWSNILDLTVSVWKIGTDRSELVFWKNMDYRTVTSRYGSLRSR